MAIFQAVVLLLAGVGVFIVGMNMLSDGLQKTAGGGMKRLLGKISNNRFAGVGVGAGVTAIVQSSSATSVMVIGFVNAGILTLFQATAIIMGANIGTTVTGVIVSLKSLGITTYATLLAFVGVMMTFFKKDKVKQIGGILCGFGLIFIGLDIMGDAFDLKKFPEINAFFVNLFETISFPILLIVFGAVFTALIQSSSAATGIFITMVGAGALRLDCALFLVLGSNVGTCVTALIACLGAGANAKRTALIHFNFNVIGMVFFSAVIWIFKDFAVSVLQGLMPGNPQMQLAWFHVIFNVTTTLILLPFIKQLVKFATTVVKDKNATPTRKLKFVDDLLLKTPTVALVQVKKEILYMASLANENLTESFVAVENGADEYSKEVGEKEEIIDFTNNALTKYLIKLSSKVDAGRERKIGAYFHVLNDLERIGDHADNFYEIGVEMKAKGLSFSETAVAELKEMGGKVMEMFAIASQAFDNLDASRLNELTELENQVDALKRELTARHYDRLTEGKCNIELSPYFSSVVVGFERVADHLVNVGYSVLNPTGSQSEARKQAKA